MAWDMTEINKQNKYSGTTAWNEAGVTGKGVVVWNCENPVTAHAYSTTQRVLNAAPDATVITESYSMISDVNSVTAHYIDYQGKRYDIEEFIKTFNIKIITKSVAGGTRTGGADSKYWNNLKAKYNLIFFNAAGNEGTAGCSGAIPPDVALYVGACSLMNGKPRRSHYSSVGEELDFMAFTELAGGTSCASPYLAGMTALLCQLKPNITQDEVCDYFRTYAEDMEEAGRDDYSGYGLAKMGDLKDMETEIRIKIGENYMTVDGKKVALDQPAVIDKKTNRTLIPVRAITEALGCEVMWDAQTKTITIRG